MRQEVAMTDILERIQYFLTLFTSWEKKNLKEKDLTRSAVTILNLLDDKLPLMEITKRSGLDKSTISRQLKNMEAKDLVKRETGEDKRFAYFSKTSKGKERWEAYHSARDEQLKTMLFSWTEQEKQMLIVLLGRFSNRLSYLLEDYEEERE